MSSEDLITEGLKNMGTIYTDCTIRYGEGKTRGVHRFIMHVHSPTVFGQRLSSMAEGDSTIDMDTNDSPDAIEAMCTYIYSNTYNVPASTSALAFHVVVFEIADKYEMDALRHFACTSFDDAVGGDSWTVTDLCEATAKVQQIINIPGALQMKEGIIGAIARCSHDLVDAVEFKNFVQNYPEWVVRLLKVYKLEAKSLEDETDLAASDPNDWTQTELAACDPNVWNQTDMATTDPNVWNPDAFIGAGRPLGKDPMSTGSKPKYGQQDFRRASTNCFSRKFGSPWDGKGRK